jgi:polysaccharide export outer membrane protein
MLNLCSGGIMGRNRVVAFKGLQCVALIAVAASLAGCGGGMSLWGANDTPVASTTASPPPATAAIETRLKPGDRMKIVVFGQESFSGDYVVDGAGNITLPIAGPVPATGLTSRELEVVLAEKLRQNQVANPQVSVLLDVPQAY